MEDAEIAPLEAPLSKKIRVKVYFNPARFKDLADDATAAGFRRGGLRLFVQKPHGFSNEVNANTDGMSRFLKECWKFWKEHREEYARLKKKEELARQLEALDKGDLP